MQEMAELFAAEQPEIDRLDADVLAMLKEFSYRTITARTMRHWEELMGFSPAPGWDIQRRRDRIYSRLITASPITPKRLQEIIEKVGSVECEVLNDASVPCATVKFLGAYGVPVYIEDIKKEVEAIRPYHVPVYYQYAYPLVQDYYPFTCERLSAYTIDQMIGGEPLDGV